MLHGIIKKIIDERGLKRKSDDKFGKGHPRQSGG